MDFVPASTAGDQSFGQRQMGFIDSIDTMLLGRVTYKMFVEYWPKVTAGEDKPFADKLNALPKIVFSQTIDRAPWGAWDGAAIVRSSAAKEVARLKQQSGKDMVIWGSIALAQSLMKEGGDRRIPVDRLSRSSGKREAALPRQRRYVRHDIAEYEIVRSRDGATRIRARKRYIRHW